MLGAASTWKTSQFQHDEKIFSQLSHREFSGGRRPFLLACFRLLNYFCGVDFLSRQPPICLLHTWVQNGRSQWFSDHFLDIRLSTKTTDWPPQNSRKTTQRSRISASLLASLARSDVISVAGGDGRRHQNVAYRGMDSTEGMDTVAPKIEPTYG